MGKSTFSELQPDSASYTDTWNVLLVLYSLVLCNTVKWSTVQVQYSTVVCSIVHYCAV